MDTIAENQYTRNELLARLLSECSIEEATSGKVGRRYFLARRGEGVGVIVRESEESIGKRPLYKQIDPELKLTIYAAPLLHY